MTLPPVNRIAQEPQLSISTSSFSELRRFHQIYVDKTALIYSLACRRGKFFLTRPRRFGKSLLVSTLESLFRDGLKWFEGLAIEPLWKDTTYKVVRFDFLKLKNFQTFDEFRENFYQRLEAAFAPYGFKYDPTSHLKFVIQWGLWLQQQDESTFVLLIDEYDAPLCVTLENSSLFAAVRSELASFYGEVKSNDQAFRFVFMTGITKFNQTGIFSELNDFTDITLDSAYGALLGYTEEEVRRCFGFFLERAQRKLGMPPEELLRELTEYYDGFCFDENISVRVFNPWSLMQFLQSPSRKFQNYWIETGGLMTVLLKYFKSHSLKNPAQFQEEKRISKAVLTASADEKTISDIALLTQTGYLTIKKFHGGNFYVGYPNREVADSMASLYSELLLSGKQLDDVDAGAIDEVLAEGAGGDVVEQFNRIFAALDYFNYPVTNESVCRGYLFVLLQGAQLYAKLEVHNAYGRSDLEVDAGDRHWVFELKFLAKTDGASNEKAAKLLAEAAEQMRSKHYGEEDRSGRDLKRLALVFSEEKRQFTAWQAV